jgi:hypothetical protein
MKFIVDSKSRLEQLEAFMESDTFREFQGHLQDLQDELFNAITTPPADSVGAVLLREQLIGETRQCKELAGWFELKKIELQEEITNTENQHE